jgi:hypothetical protein
MASSNHNGFFGDIKDKNLICPLWIKAFLYEVSFPLIHPLLKKMLPRFRAALQKYLAIRAATTNEVGRIQPNRLYDLNYHLVSAHDGAFFWVILDKALSISFDC